MKTVLMNICLLLSAQMFGQLKVDTELSEKDSIIVLTLQNSSEYRMTIYNRAYISDVWFYFIDMKGDTVRRDWHSYGEGSHLRLQPKETKRMRYLRLKKINFEGLHSIRVKHRIDYGINDTVFYRKTGNYPFYRYEKEVVFDIQKILHPSDEEKEAIIN